MRLIDGARQVAGERGSAQSAAGSPGRRSRARAAQADAGVHFLGLLGLDARQKCTDMGLEFRRMGGFGQIIVGAGLKARDLVIQLGLGCEKQDGGCGW